MIITFYEMPVSVLVTLYVVLLIFYYYKEDTVIAKVIGTTENEM